ncbi:MULTISPECIES: TonB family protein [unclassified Oceanobacter]|jgi:protein TonB|uniref:TonB family protein n=1 Tax=unclassified Oceanobacter TaxID=2620260 RepID=UPI0026E32944|nr:MULTISPECIES: TonB family protein [unclassified Oceanobacter]MDO6681516.1 TonB family protein [Oceanobacter sp. 5_MG-2023]MDP2506647.1 TonB family protein [Oceanobacter sp. 3_MG-2023]
MSLRPFTLWHGALISVLLHALIALPWLLDLQAAPVAESKELLVIELDGLESQVQQQQQHLGARPQVHQPVGEARPTPPPVAAAQAVEAEPDPVKKAPRQPESPVKVKQTPPQPKPQTAAQAAQVPPTAQAEEKQAIDAGQKQQQQQQTLQRPEISKSALRHYLARLKKSIQSNLEYPDDARRYRQTGMPVVSFRLREDGHLEPGSLHLARSSGFPQLDQRALAAATASAPFDRPPKVMQVAIAISFARASR